MGQLESLRSGLPWRGALLCRRRTPPGTAPAEMRKLAFVVFLATMLPMRGIRSLVRTGSWAQLRGLRSLLGIAVLFLARIAARRRFEEEEEEEGWAQDARRWLDYVRQKEVSFAHPALLRRNSLR